MDSPIAFENGRIIDGTGAAPRTDVTVVVADGIIEAVGLPESIEMPPDTKRMNLKGKTLMPGLIDAHVHLTLPETQPFYTEWASQAPEELVLFAVDAANRTIEAGFTTVRDVGACGYIDVALRDAVASGTLAGPRILAAGPGICQTGGHGSYEPPWLELPLGSIAQPADGPTGVRRAVRERMRRHTDLVKTFATGGASDAADKLAIQEFTAEEMTALYDEAHRAETPVAVHCFTPEACHRALSCGMHGQHGDTLEHGMYLHADPTAIDAMVDADVPLVPTFSVYGRMAEGEEAGLPPSSVENARATRGDHIESFEIALDRGATIVCGTDTGGPLTRHGNNAQELVEMHKRGLSAMATIVAATGDAAEAIGLGDVTGTIEPGKAADLIVVDGDPTRDLSVLLDGDNPVIVMRDGAVLAGRATNWDFERPL